MSIELLNTIPDVKNALTINNTPTIGNGLYVDDVFSAYTYTGTGAAQTINNGIDLAGKGGMVWTKCRSHGTSSDGHFLHDSARGQNNWLSSNRSDAQWSQAGPVFNSTGWTYNAGSNAENVLNQTYVSWTFRKAAKFFDIVTYTGDGTNTKRISHNLGITPGMVIIKRTDNSGDWWVSHISTNVGNPQYFRLNSAAAGLYAGAATTPTVSYQTWSDTSTIDISSGHGSGNSFPPPTNITGAQYIAYLFAHDTDTTNGIVQCGSFTDGSPVSINLGWEPQYIMVKRVDPSSDWLIVDISRGQSHAKTYPLRANTTDTEGDFGTGYLIPTASGFTTNAIFSVGSNVIYLAIRRPNKPATTGTQVYNSIARTGTGTAATVTGVGFAPDLIYSSIRSGSGSSNSAFVDKLRGANKRLTPYTNGGEDYNGAVTDFITSFNNNGITLGADAGVQAINSLNNAYINHFFKRSPGIFDIVCYTGGVSNTIYHNLDAVPELIIIKRRNSTSSWVVWHSSLTYDQSLELHSTVSKTSVFSVGMWNSTLPTKTSFSVGSNVNTNGSSTLNVAYLFASKPGISKVGSYTGNGTNQTINAGFSTGARFVLIKKTSDTGDWLVGDSTRGITTGNDPLLKLNTTLAEVTNEDWLDPDPTGFIVNQTTCDANANGATYIYLAFS